MEIRKAFPPNIDAIRAAGLGSDSAIYCYGGKIYNPAGREIPADILHHETLHIAQQGTDSEGWWRLYLVDPSFRLTQELEAYGEQYAFAKRHMHGKILEWGLDDMARALSGQSYGSLISHGEAVSKIRNWSPRV